jgi:hypothetical protein
MQFTLREAAGGLGDLGVFIPLLVGMVNKCGLQLGSALLLAGAMNFITGVLFRIPMPVQPMKAIAAVAISEGANEAQILEAGIACGTAILLLGISGSIDWLSRHIPLAVVRGLQLSLGLKLIYEGLLMVFKTRTLTGWDGAGLGLVCAAIAFALHKSRRMPAALLIFGVGLVALYAAHGNLFAGLRFGFQWHLPDLANPADWKWGVFHAALPQIPLTLLNSVVAVCALSRDLFPRSPAQPTKVAVSVALMNLVCCPLGGMPMCHGAGGLAGQYRFGARSGGSIVILGAAKMLLALTLGGSIGLLLQNYPQNVLGVLLAAGGVELAIVCRDQKSLSSLAVLALTAITCLTLGIVAGFALGWLVVAAAMFWRKRRPGEGGPA